MNEQESGQAMMELTIMLLILSGMMLAVIMLSGIEITSNNILLSARNNAQKAARDSYSENAIKDNEISDWQYTTLNLTNSYIRPEQRGSFGKSTTLIRYNNRNYKLYSSGDGTVQIPFTYQSHSDTNQAEHTLSQATFGMTSELFTRPHSASEYEQYSKWMPLAGMDTSFKHDFSENVRSGNAFNAASLVAAEGDGSNAPATINHSHQAGAHSRSDAANVMYSTFSKIFGIKLRAIDLKSHETNRVYMPLCR